jgi:hypothetical protein
VWEGACWEVWYLALLCPRLPQRTPILSPPPVPAHRQPEHTVITAAGQPLRDSLGRTPAMVASAMGRLDILTAVLGAPSTGGPSADAVDAEGDTALHHAAMGGRVKAAAVLLLAGAALHLKNNSGLTCLGIAAGGAAAVQPHLPPPPPFPPPPPHPLAISS